MKNVLITVAMCLLSTMAHARGEVVDKPVFCSSLKTIIETVTGNFGESPSWRGNDDKSNYILTVNQKTGSWTMIQYNDQVACVIGFGFNSQAIYTGKSV